MLGERTTSFIQEHHWKEGAVAPHHMCLILEKENFEEVFKECKRHERGANSLQIKLKIFLL